jgi:uncharacterized protein (DUF342 family)
MSNNNNKINKLLINKYDEQIVEYEEKINKYEEKIAKLQSKLSNIELLKEKIESNKISKDDESDDDQDEIDNNGVNYKHFILKNIADRKRILENMQNDLPEKNFKVHTIKNQGLFGHVDNIRFVYNECGLECPKWYVKKYGHMFQENN